MILETIELIGNELSIEALQTKVNNGDFNDILVKYDFLIMTAQGLVKVKKNKEIILNPIVDLNSYSTTTEINTKLDAKVDKVNGKELSTNDYDNTEKQNVASNTNARHTHDNKSILDTITNELLNSFETVNNKVTNVSNESTNDEYPSAKLLYDELENVKSLISELDVRIQNLENN